MQTYLDSIIQKAQQLNKTIVFPEGAEDRILQATEEIQKQEIAQIILLGNPQQIKEKANHLNLKIDFTKTNIIDPQNSELKNKLEKRYQQLRDEQVDITDINYFGTMLVETGLADGMVSGTTFPTADTIRPALKILRQKEEFHKVSGVFFMMLQERLLLLADCAVTIEPSAEELAFITLDTIQTAKEFGIKPKVALLSFSTFASAQHPKIDKLKETLKIVREKSPETIIDGELQVDAALVPDIAKRKCPKSQIQGDANILIFPNLEAANIAYKLVQRLAGAQAIGPILQGLKKPINDLSRGCSFHDIVHLTAFTAVQSHS